MSDTKWCDFADETFAQRQELVLERIREIPGEQIVPEVYRDCFSQLAEFYTELDRIYRAKKEGKLAERTLDACRADQERLYRWYLPENYCASYANPAYAVQQLGADAGEIVTFLFSESEAGIGYAFEGRLMELTILSELFVQVYNCFVEEDFWEARQTIYWFFHDYSEIFVENQIREMISPEDNFFTDMILHSDLEDLRYLYQYGLPIGENELGIAAFLNRMSADEIQAMADTYTEGYRIGFEVTGKDITKKKTVQLNYQVGFERMMRAAIKNFAKLGLSVTISREPRTSFLNKGAGKRGAYATSLNRQYDFDHREDKALYFDKGFVERRLEVLRTVFEQHRIQAAEHGGPAVLEVFGEPPFSPEAKKESIHYSEKQQQLLVYNASASGQITNEYLKGEERSFTIIAYPIPEIGKDFEEIFAETVVINTLDYIKYRDMQQCLIDVLDQAVSVEITGRGGNRTNLKVSILPLSDPEKQTAFENCVADVNIPVGEVFTSPVLKGTNGVLHVSEVFLNGLQYQDLELTFTDGMVTDYRCGNFADEEENKKYIRDNVLMRHDTLPMGEFAIGTNTTAYRMARRYGIADKLPILIAEKTGPHFAVGDTCYSHAEDTSVYNPNGKEIMARDNEISLLRREDAAKAYYNCHTDITIPYEELGAITVVKRDGSREDIIRDGLFQVAGAGDLNIPLRNL